MAASVARQQRRVTTDVEKVKAYCSYCHVLIDRDSIKPNPDAGSTAVQVPGQATTEITTKDGTVTGITQSRDVYVIHLMEPQGKYLFKYAEQPLAECRYCSEEFPAGLLADEDYYDDESGYTTVDEICPECKQCECLSLSYKFESIIDAMKEMEEHARQEPD